MPDSPLPRRDRFFIGLLIAIAIGYGVYVEMRSAFMQRRHTDLGVYLRASWAISAGQDPYQITDDNGWHYSYPSLFAIVLVPFADAPPGEPQPSWAVPYPVSVGLWYAASFLLLCWSAHHLCRALEDTHPGGPQRAAIGTRRYWWLRTAPIWICLPAVGSTLSRGQVNLLLVALLCGFIAASLRQRRASAGWWLAAATCLKVIPGLLLLYPLVRRDWRTVGHFALGMAVGMGAIPVAVLGYEQAASTTVAFVEGTILPGLTSNPGRLSRELTDMTATDNQAIQAIVHNALHWDRATRPKKADKIAKLAHVVVGLALIAATFIAAQRIKDERYRILFLLSGLVIVSVAVTPVNHTHYMVLGFPAVLGLIYREMEQRRNFSWGSVLILVMTAHLASGIFPRIPGFDVLRDSGVTMLGTLVVWFAALTLPAASIQIALPQLSAFAIPRIRIFR